MFTKSNSIIPHAVHGPTMGTRFSAIFLAPESVDLASIKAALQASVDIVDQQMSTWKPQSDLMRLNGAPVGEWQTLPHQLLEVLSLSEQVRNASKGAFDIAVGELVDAWGFGPDMDQPNPNTLAKISELQNGVAKTSLEIDPQCSAARRLENKKIDLNGVAKGYGVDQLAKTLIDNYICDFLVSIDGELRASGTNLNNQAWVVGVEKPLINERQILKKFELHDLAVATSGNYRHFFDIAGTRISHTMDPRNAQPVKNTIASITVFATTCAAADAWATAIWVGGPEMAEKAKSMGQIVDAFIV